MAITMQLGFDEAIDLLQNAQKNAHQEQKVTLVFDNEQKFLLDSLPEGWQNGFVKHQKLSVANSNDGTADTRQIIDFSQLPSFGMWADRQEMVDSVAYIEALRQEQWS